MRDPASKLLSGNRNAKSDVANKLISMFLHDLSQEISKTWKVKVSSAEYVDLVRNTFKNLCPYCSRELTEANSIIEHLDGMNRLRAGLHIPGNVLVACKQCNNEKRRDDSQKGQLLAPSGWESFLSHDSTNCKASCRTCQYWADMWRDEEDRKKALGENLQRIHLFRSQFAESRRTHDALVNALPDVLATLYSDGQTFAESRVKSLLVTVKETPSNHS